jgi:hypothetical protein
MLYPSVAYAVVILASWSESLHGCNLNPSIGAGEVSYDSLCSFRNLLKVENNTENIYGVELIYI